MRIRPEARQRLEYGFQRRIDEQKRRFAVQWQNAVEFGQRSGLGQAIGIFRAQIYPPLRLLFIVRMIAPLVAIPVLIIAAVKGVPGMSRLLFLAPFLFGGWIGVNSLLAWRNRTYRWLFAYADGFTEFDESAQPDRSTRWDDFTDVADSWTWADSETSSNSWTFDGLQLTVHGGTATLFNTPYKNMLDPYHPVNRMWPRCFLRQWPRSSLSFLPSSRSSRSISSEGSSIAIWQLSTPAESSNAPGSV